MKSRIGTLLVVALAGCMGFAWADDAHEMILVGSDSPALKKLSVRTLSQQTPCAAVALMLFKPSEGLWDDWVMYLDGVPTTRTANLMADGAAVAEIGNSTLDPGTSPFGDQLVLALEIRTEKLPSDRVRSTILCSLARAHAPEMKSSLLEPPVRFTWSLSSRELLGIDD